MKYKLSYTVYDEAKPSEVDHQDVEFESESDLLGAADEGMSYAYEKFAEGTTRDILFRKIELLDPKEVYKNIIAQAKGRKNAS